jgi:hypothetical protein
MREYIYCLTDIIMSIHLFGLRKLRCATRRIKSFEGGMKHELESCVCGK